MADDKLPPTLDDLILKEITKLHMTQEEAKKVLKQLQRPEQTKNSYNHFWGTKKARLGVISDSHIGSKYFDYQAFDDSVKMFDKHKVDGIYHCGDVIEGMSNRDGHIYELEKIGTSAQVNHAADLLNQYNQPLYFITGNHDNWSKSKANQGVQVGEMLEDKLNNAKWLGDMYARIQIAPNVAVDLTHEGSTAYALSYSSQKRINALPEKDKPDVKLNGHIHKALYMYYRDIHALETGTFQKQTPFMQMKGSPAHVGYWVLDLEYNKKHGLTSMTPKFFPYE